MSDNGFIDLRIGYGTRGPGDDSVWPSFTDIMTVVVMIFLMALVIIIVRNNDLNRQLLSSIDANEVMSSANRGLSTELQDLKVRVESLQRVLGDSESDKAALNKELLKQIALLNSLTARKQALDQELANLSVLKQDLEGENLSLLAEKNRLIEENSALKEGSEALQNEKQGLLARSESLEMDRDTLQQEKTSLSAEVENLMAARRQLETELEAAQLANQGLEADRTALTKQSQDQQQSINKLIEQEQLLSRQLAQVNLQLKELETSAASEAAILTEQSKGLEQQLNALNLTMAQLNLELEDRKKREKSLNEQIAVQQLEFDQLKSSEQQALTKFTLASGELEALGERIANREREIRSLQDQADTRGSEFISLQEEYNALEEKYRTLVRAARSPAGKQVAAVYFSRSGSGYEFRLQEPGSVAVEEVSKGELDRRLSALKSKFGRNLYTKVVIPQDSNLTHNEAWRFTQEILNNYDYYYQSPGSQ